MEQPPGFAPGTQQDAAECLMRILEHVDRGGMQARVCGAGAASSVESMILCRASEDAQVSRANAPVSMAAVLQTSLTGDQAMWVAPLTMVVAGVMVKVAKAEVAVASDPGPASK